MLYAIIGLLFLLVDQFLKFWTVAHIPLNDYPGKELIPGVLNMTYIKNAGAAFGLFSKFSGLRWVLLALLVAFTAFIVLGLTMRYLRTGFARWTGVLLLSGLLGNGIDRAIYGYVVDMFEPKLGSITWPIFNLADCLVVIFGILFCIAVLTGGLGSPEGRYDDDDDEDVPVRRRAPAPREEESREHRKARPHREEEAHRRPQRPRDEEAPARRKPQRPRDEDETARRPHRVHAEDADQAPVRRRPPQTAEAAPARRREAPESEATVSTVARPVSPRPAVTAEAPTPAPKPQPRPEPRPEPKPVPKAEPVAEKKPETDEFDLDSILAEFK